MSQGGGSGAGAGWLPSEETVRRFAIARAEPSWLLAMRLEALGWLIDRPEPAWTAGLTGGVFATLDPADHEAAQGDDGRQPPDDLAERGVVICPLPAAVGSHPELVRRYLGSVVSRGLGPPDDVDRAVDEQVLACIGAAGWSGGMFVYVPPGIEIEVPLQAVSRGRPGALGRFERTLVVAGAGSKVHYIEGCSAPVYTADPLRSALVEVVVGAGADVAFTTIQNWSDNVSSLVVKRATVEAGGRMEWIDGTIGSRWTVTHPTVVLAGREASGLVRSLSYAGRGQRLEVGARMIHRAPQTTSMVLARTIAGDGGRSRHDGLAMVESPAEGATATVRCDALLLDDRSQAEAELRRQIDGQQATIDEASTTVGLDDDQLFYLASRGLSPEQAARLVVNGFIEPVTRGLPMEYAIEWSRLIELQMARSIG